MSDCAKNIAKLQLVNFFQQFIGFLFDMLGVTKKPSQLIKIYGSFFNVAVELN